MIIKNLKPHLGDALMILAMMKDDDVYAGTQNCNALLMNNVKTIPVEHCVHWDIDVSDIGYSDWEGYAKTLNVTWNGKPAKLILSKEEFAKCKIPDTSKKKVGVCCCSRDKCRSYPHWKELVKQLSKYYETHIFGLQQLPVRQLVSEVSQMDLFVSCDTGLAHIAGSLDIPLLIIEGPTDCQKLYSCYQNVRCVSTNDDKCEKKPCINTQCKYVNCMYLIHPGTIVSAISVEKVLLPQASAKPLILETKYQDAIAFLRLDGLGGTVTLSDQAKKVKELYDYPVALIVRGYKELFEANPDIDEVITVGMTNWHACLNAFKYKFVALADIRFAPAKWYQQRQLFNQDFSEFEEMYEDFGISFKGYNELVRNSSLHHVQQTDKVLGFPYDTIDMDIYSLSYDMRQNLPSEYICINNGVDVIHKGVNQTKCWEGWKELIHMFSIPVIQIGTNNDVPIPGAIDLRGKTDLKNLCGVLKGAKNIVCNEGGVMHLAYALHHPDVVVIQGPTRGKMFEYPGQKIVASYLCEPCVFTKPDWYLHCYMNADAVCMKSITPERVYETMVAN